jgi:putative acetyltransferase
MFEIREDDLSGEATQTLVAFHQQAMYDASPPGTSFALDLSGLKVPEVTVWSAWRGEKIAAIGALKMLGQNQAELKSMRTHPDFLRQGAAALLLEHILDEAARRGLSTVSLETGTGPDFEAALTLYRKRGFMEGDPFADYAPSPFNQFFHLALAT